MKRILTTAFIWAALAALVASAFGAEPKAKVIGPKSLAPGASTLLDASGSAWDAEQDLQWSVVGSDAPLKILSAEGKAGAFAYLTAPEGASGTITVAVAAAGTPDGSKKLKYSFALLTIVVGKPPAPAPVPVPIPVPPDPGPNPVPPAPTPPLPDPLQAAGYAYGVDLARTYGAAAKAAAASVRSGARLADVTAKLKADWAKTHGSAFDGRFHALFEAIVPIGQEPATPAARAKLADLIDAIATGALGVK